MIIPSAPSNIQSRYTLLSLDDLFDPPRPIPPPPSTPLTPVEMFESVWDKWSIKRLVWKIRGYNDPLYGQDDLEQEAFLRVWQNVELKDREIQSVEGYVFTTVERRLLEILRQIVKDRWNLRGPVYYDQMEDKFFGFSDWDEALDVGPVDWSALPSVESRVKLGEVVSAIERYALTSEMRRATFGDLLAVSGATGEASNETLARCAETKQRSDFRAVCAMHGMSKKQQEKFRAAIRKALHTCGRHIEPRKRSSGKPMYGPPQFWRRDDVSGVFFLSWTTAPSLAAVTGEALVAFS